MKVLATLLALTVASVSFAANCKWSAVNLDAAFEGGTAYLVQITSGTSTLETIKNALETDGIAASTPANYNVAMSATIIAIDAYKEWYGDFGAHNGGLYYDWTTDNPTAASANVFVIAVSGDQKKYAMSDITAVGNATQIHVGMTGGSAWAATGTIVPEPTVLALLALGVAGLALKRKNA